MDKMVSFMFVYFYQNFSDAKNHSKDDEETNCGELPLARERGAGRQPWAVPAPSPEAHVGPWHTPPDTQPPGLLSPPRGPGRAQAITLRVSTEAARAQLPRVTWPQVQPQLVQPFVSL